MPKNRSKIPRHEPEVVVANAREYGGDEEKVATTSIKSLAFDGIKITSRYDKADELIAMQDAARELSTSQRKNVISIFCDSKRTNSYSVLLLNWNKQEALAIASRLENAFLKFNGGHNGITVAANNQTVFGDYESRINVDSSWSIDFE